MTFIFGFYSLISASNESKKCSNELAKVVFRPPNAAYESLKEISKVLKVQSELLFTNQNKSIIAEFMITYRTAVFVVDAFGNILPYTVADPNFRPPFPPQIQAQINALGFNLKAKNVGYYQLYTMDDGFFASKLPANFYSFIIRNRNGEMYTIFLAAPKGRTEDFCNF